ncbi:hypothetical protein GGD92_22410 [Pseudomonas protegens]|uniref:Uncharacterized protein n=1 Tax=Pseudomonas protegens TaxID=380021 RepID=A0A7G7XL41_9PSED|nr:hypothetical protein GGI48_17485 [Pseudomonas protegens]QNL08955.1 hypothetical protein GGD92_22410 [Pseudomonas protegens]
MRHPSPHGLRAYEKALREREEKIAQGTYTPAPFENIETHEKYDQERFRFAQLPFRSQFWLFMQVFGKYGFYLFAILFAFVSLFLSIVSRDSQLKIGFWDALSSVFWPILFPTLLCWGVGHIVMHHFPRIWFRPPKGPLWELNRRTGLVTFFDYKRFKKEGVIDEVTAPFYEFDAYIVTSPDRQGSPMNGLFLIHRYRDIRINFNSLITPDNTLQKPWALWDFFQNFMDISRPLPDIPLYEPYRYLDPVTAEYDRQQQRPARYWIDMDDETFKAKVKEMLGKIDAIDTFNRPNLMANHVQYID